MEFTKIQGAGNDFIIINNIKIGLSLNKLSRLAKIICKRKLSIGADGLIVIELSHSNADFKMRFFNTDGSIAEMCGNGARCAARYAYENKIVWDSMVIETIAGEVYAWRVDKRKFKIKLNNPSRIDLYKEITINNKCYKYSYIELGNPGVPHVVINYKGLDSIDNKELFPLAKEIRENKIFYKGANVTFYDIIGNDCARIKTFERGVEDFTLSCGTGAGAVAVAMSCNNELKGDEISLDTDGGRLLVQIEKNIDEVIKNVFLTGDTNIICTGEITDEDLTVF